jgi:hypothetical protein
MLPDSDDDAPVTRRTPPASGRAPDALVARKKAREADLPTHPHWFVWIFYREPSYAEHSGIHKTYSFRFVVQATDERAAVAKAKAEFAEMAATSGVGWGRVIERIVCDRAGDADRE